MNVHTQGFKLKKLMHYCLLSGCIYLGGGLNIIYAQEQTADSENYAEFDASPLVGGIKTIDLSQYRHGNPIIAGRYNSSIYVNGEWSGKRELEFQKQPDSEIVEHCFTLQQLIELNIDSSALDVQDPQQCMRLEQWIPGATTRFNNNEFRYDISVPQAYLQRTARGTVPYQVWDRGINAGYLSYSFNSNQNINHGEHSNNSYLSLSTGLNLAGWQLRHNAVLSKYAGQETEYNSLNSYVEKGFGQIGSVLTLGDSYTAGDLFDSFAFRGAQIRSEDRMLAETQAGYAPQIRGVAQSNAMVEVHYNNQLIHQVSVAPGEFIIDDLYPTGSGGALQVIVREANGQVQQFSVPYSSVSLLLRPGKQRYSVTAGQVRNDSLSERPSFIQATYQRGLNNLLTGYAGSILGEDYQAYQFGTAWSTRIGAVAFDVTHAQTENQINDPNNPLQLDKNNRGQRYRLSYHTAYLPSQTQFNLAASQYSTSGYADFQTANAQHDLQRRGLSGQQQDKQKAQIQWNLNQNLKPGWGSLYFTGVWKQSWQDSSTQTDYQLGYQNSYKQLSYSLSAQRLKDDWGQRDDHYTLMLTLPLQFRKNNTTLTQRISDDGNSSSISGSRGDHREMSFHAAVSDIGYAHDSLNTGLQYRTPYMRTGLSASVGHDYQQYGVNLTGTVVAHRQGLSFSPEQADTMVLVQAEDATGAYVKNTSGLKIDRWGYAVIPYVTAYRLNEISLDPKNVTDQVEMLSNLQVLAPYAGAISKVEFKTKKGFQVLIKAKQPSGAALPFAANVENAQGEQVGVVTQGSQLLIRTESLRDTLTVKWGDTLDPQQCQLNYQIDPAQKKNQQGYHVLEGQCL